MRNPFKAKFNSLPPKDTRVYAIGDIHGQCGRLLDLQEKIMSDAARAPEKRLVVVYLGDFVDRGPDTAAVLDLLIEKPLPGFTSVFLKGNHEEFVLRYLDGDMEAGGNWVAYGGDATLRSYGIEATERWPDYTDLIAWQRAFSRCFPVSHRRFLENLPLSHIEGDYAFVHAGIRPGKPFAEQDANDLLWIREEFHNSKEDHGFVIVHGHSVTPQAQNFANRIGIDTGAGYGNRLTAVVLSGTSRNFLRA